MRSNVSRYLPAILVASVLGCSPTALPVETLRPDASLSAEASAEAARGGESAPPTAPSTAPSTVPSTASSTPQPAPARQALVASTDRGLALVVAGKVTAETTTEALVHDLVVVGDRVLTFETSDEGDGGTIVERTLAGDSFGPPQEHRRIDGRARLASTPAGIVLFESSYGDRWRVLSSHVGSSFVAPMPSAAWWDGTHLTVLVRDADALFSLRAVTVTPSSITEATRVDLPTLRHDTARATPRHVIDLVDGQIVVRRSDEQTSLGLASAGLGDAVDLRRGVAFTASGPPRLVVVAADGAPRTLPLDQVYADAELLAHTLVPLDDDHLAVATPTSLVLVHLGAKLDVVTQLRTVHAPIAAR